MKNFDQIAEFGQKLMRLKNVEQVLELISDKAKSFVDADRCSIFIVDKEDKILWTKFSDGLGRIVIALDSGVVGDTYSKQKSQIVNEPYEDERFLQNIDKQSGYKTENMITVPIFDSKRNVMGIIQLLNKFRNGFNEADEEVLAFFACLKERFSECDA